MYKGMVEASRVRMSTDDRREQLLSAGVELLRRRPHEEVSIEDIAEAAGVSKAAISAFIRSELYAQLAMRSTYEDEKRRTTNMERCASFLDAHVASLTQYFAIL